MGFDEGVEGVLVGFEAAAQQGNALAEQRVADVQENGPSFAVESGAVGVGGRGVQAGESLGQAFHRGDQGGEFLGAQAETVERQGGAAAVDGAGGFKLFFFALLLSIESGVVETGLDLGETGGDLLGGRFAGDGAAWGQGGGELEGAETEDVGMGEQGAAEAASGGAEAAAEAEFAGRIGARGGVDLVKVGEIGWVAGHGVVTSFMGPTSPSSLRLCGRTFRQRGRRGRWSCGSAARVGRGSHRLLASRIPAPGRRPRRGCGLAARRRGRRRRNRRRTVVRRQRRPPGRVGWGRRKRAAA